MSGHYGVRLPVRLVAGGSFTIALLFMGFLPAACATTPSPTTVIAAPATSLPADTQTVTATVAPTAVPTAIRDTPIANTASATLTIDGFPDWLAIGFDSVWVSNSGVAAVQRIDLKSNAVVGKINVSDPCAAMAIGYDSVWVANCTTDEIYRIDPKTNTVIAKIKGHLASSESSITAGEGGVWFVSSYLGVLSRIDPATNKVTAEITVTADSRAVMAGYGAVWVTSSNLSQSGQGILQRINPQSNSVVATVTVGIQPRFLAVGEGSVWVLNQSDGSVTRVDPKTNKVAATIETGAVGNGGDIAAGEGSVWVRGGGTLLIVIDPATNKIVRRYGPPQGSGAVCAESGSVWVSAHDVNKIWRLNPNP